MINNSIDIKSAVLLKKNNIDQILRITLKSGYILFVPIEKANADYQKYLAWISQGNSAIIENI
jgi:hypothetical protein